MAETSPEVSRFVADIVQEWGFSARHYLPADSSAKGVLPDLGRNVETYEDYVHWMETIKRLFPGCAPYEINTFLDTQSKTSFISKQTKFFQISTNAYNDDTDYWKQTGELEEAAPFNENHYVYTGGAGAKREYPLKDPKPGDVILVRYSPSEGRAIGVVEENGYASDGWSEDAVISVHWINKTSTILPEMEPVKQMPAFTRGDRLLSACRNADAYKVSFEWIDHLTGNVESQSDDELSTEEPHISFPLNAVLFGPPGTGKTWEAVSHAVAIIDSKDRDELADSDRASVKQRFDALKAEGRVEFVTFHQNYAYEDFIEGIRPSLNGVELTYEMYVGIFRQISSRAKKHRLQPHVLIIDEINRGNIAKIFGELITLIEPSKRLGGEDRTEVTLRVWVRD